MRTFLHRPQSTVLRRALFQLHLWTGIAAGLYLSVVCGTGAALVVRIEMQRATYPHLFAPSAAGPLADPVTIMEQVQAAYPGGRLSGVDAPTTARPTYLAYVLMGPRFLTVLVDPVSARVLGLLPDQSWIRTLQDLHFDLLAGRTGRVLNGIGALLLLAMCVTGLVIWWPGVAQWKGAFTVDLGRSWKRMIWELHRAIGVWTLVATVMWAVTGAYFAFPAPFRSMVNRVSAISIVRTPESHPPEKTTSAPGWQTLVDAARQVVPGQFIARIVVPSSSRAPFLVMFSSESPAPVSGAALTSVYLDQYTGAVRRELPVGSRTTGDAVMAWIAPLHMGNFGGPAVRAAWLTLGLAPPLLFVTGFVMWWVRVVRPRRARGGSST